MKARILRVAVVALITILVGLNILQWRMDRGLSPIQSLPSVAETQTLPVAPAAPMPPEGCARNVILLIGDGMGVAHTTAASVRRGGANGRLNMERMPVTGLARTHSASNLVTDSAAAATALSTGTRTRNEVLGQAPDGATLRHLLEHAASAGRATGIVTTDRVTGATPAGFSVHVSHRDNTAEIAAALLDAPLDLLLGGGSGAFDSNGLLDAARDKGWQVALNTVEMDAAPTGRLLGLFAKKEMPFENTNPSLDEMTRLALGRLSADPDGFILVAEGALIDKRSHAWKAVQVTDRVLAFDRTVGTARTFAREHPGTLVLVVADHETGGLTLTTLLATPNDPVAIWTTRGHSAAPVAIYAEGPGAPAFTGVMHLTDISIRLRKALGIAP
jgi:alkaline phosphatase